MTTGVAHPVRVPAAQVGTRRGRWTLAACVLGSALAGIDASVVNVALPALWGDLHAPFAVLQWTFTAYTLALALLILLRGATGIATGAGGCSWSASCGRVASLL